MGTYRRTPKPTDRELRDILRIGRFEEGQIVIPFIMSLLYQITFGSLRRSDAYMRQ